MKISTLIEFKEYLKLTFFLTYKRPVILIVTLLSLIYAIGYLLDLGNENVSKVTAYGYIFAGFMIIFLTPISTYFHAKKSFRLNAMLREKIEYEFTDEKMKVDGETFNSELSWEKMHKVEETKSWFLINQSNNVANLISKRFFFSRGNT